MELWNYRCFAELTIDFHPRLTVLLAENGEGKTAVLDALAVAIGPYLSVFEHGRGAGFAREDVRLRPGHAGSMEPVYPVTTRCTGWIGGTHTEWRRWLGSPKGHTTIREARELRTYAADIMGALGSDEERTLPVLAYYGTGRLWRHGRIGRGTLRVISPLQGSRTLGYRDCMDPSSNFREFTLWFRQLYLAWLQRRVESGGTADDLDGSGRLERMYDWIREAVDRVLRPSGWGRIAYDFERDAITARHADHGALSVNQLSDGVRSLLALVADIAFRCCKLNPDLGPRMSPGLVLIDEVDMHLHPRWQQRVLLGLVESFPRIQFVVTTHSPHVVSTVPRECIRVLTRTGASVPERETHGRDGNSVLAEVFGVDPEPPIPIVEKLRRYRTLAEQDCGSSEEALALRAELEQAVGPDDPRLQEIDMLLRLRARLRSAT
jgi:predicted ATP-binding protein involved in virulence